MWMCVWNPTRRISLLHLSLGTHTRTCWPTCSGAPLCVSPPFVHIVCFELSCVCGKPVFLSVARCLCESGA